MRKIKDILFLVSSLLVFLAFSQLFGCASIQHPTGGPKDSIPPKILKESPKNFTTRFKESEIDIEFDEYFKIANESKEISVSPAMEKSPAFKVRKKVLNIEFQEPLHDSTTYTINFGNGIVDNNESNVLKNYMYVFSTGSAIDSLSISGTVTNTLTEEPVLDATVFLLPTSQDSLFGKKRASLFTTTDSSGNFSIKYLRSNSYNIYALKEQGGDKIFNSVNELIGFRDKPILLAKDTTGIKLQIFKELPKTFRVTDRKIEKDGKISFIFNKQLTSPALQILQPAELNATKIVEFSPTRDTAYLWTESMEFDSINVAIQDNKVNLDTLVIRRSKRDTYARALTITDNIGSARLRPGADVTLVLSAPIKSIDGKKFTLLQDSVSVSGLRVSRDSLSTRKIHLRYSWKDEKRYSLNIAEGGFTGTFGGTSKLYTNEFSKDVKENYGEFSAVVTVPDTSQTYIVQVLNDKENIISESSIRKSQALRFQMMGIGKYYVRVIYDENRNGKWDTGSVTDRRQPEKVWNLPKEISLRANFEIEEQVVIPKSP